jgi:hypothetical protein
LVVALGKIARMKGKDVAGWSQAELKSARDLCHEAALFFNEQTKKRSTKLPRLPVSSKRRK